jgi:hypothetical protein
MVFSVSLGIYVGFLWVHFCVCVCLLLVFIFVVLEFLECLLYVLINLVYSHLHEIFTDYLQDFSFRLFFWASLCSLG